MQNSFLLCMLCFFALFVSCCSTNQTRSGESGNHPESKTDYAFNIISPLSQDITRMDDELTIKIAPLKNLSPDSVIVSNNGKKLVLKKIDNYTYTSDSVNVQAGQKNIQVNVIYSDSLNENHSVKIITLPKEAPKKLSYKLIRSFKHDAEASTQGLFYSKGYLYESTGRQNRSSIRCIDPKTGDVLKKRKLEPQYFGEGIAQIGNELYMLTYREHKGFVFDISTFKLIRDFNLQTEEGWGLTTDGNQLILSDGSAYIYTYSPEFFSLINQVEVCNNERLVNELNELELTPQGLYANLFNLQNTIVLIDFKKGVITHTLDLAGLFPENVTMDMDHVLNGIAYNPDSKSFYITGKLWPVMYEITIQSN